MPVDNRCGRVGWPVFGKIVYHNGLPVTIISDQWLQCESTFWEPIWTCLELDQWMPTAVQPQLDGQTGWMTTDVELYFKRLINFHQHNWEQLLLMAGYATNTGISELTKFTPFFIDHSMNPLKLFIGEPTEWQKPRHFKTNPVQAAIQQIHKAHMLEMSWSQEVQEDGRNRAWILVPTNPM